ncbi:MAG: hypothetical protein AAF587_26650 [Bacteroidota bacterium]
MKLNFILLTVFLLFARGCDFYSTSLWFFQENGMQDEMNPLSRFLGIGWNGLIIVNILLVGGITALHYFASFRYKAKTSFQPKPDSIWEYASQLYFGVPDRFLSVFFRLPKHKEVFLAHMGFVMVRVLIIASFLATIHNCGQYFQWGVYQGFRETVGRPLYVIFAVIGISAFFFHMRFLSKEFQTYRRLQLTRRG